MPLQLVHNVQVVDPVLVAVNASNICIRPALVANFPLQQAIIDAVLHHERMSLAWESCGELKGLEWKVAARRSTELHASMHKSASKVRSVGQEFLKVQAYVGGPDTHCGAFAICGRCW